MAEKRIHAMMENHTYMEDESRAVWQEDFIMQDEADAVLVKGSGTAGGKFRIYEYFLESHFPKENAKFLKKEYGIGGRSGALPGTDRSFEYHDSKGIRVTKGGLLEPAAEAVAAHTLFLWTCLSRKKGNG